MICRLTQTPAPAKVYEVKIVENSFCNGLIGINFGNIEPMLNISRKGIKSSKEEKCTQGIQAFIEADRLKASHSCDVKCFVHTLNFGCIINVFNSGSQKN